MKCTKCNKDIESGIRFCPSCGTPCSTTASPNGGGGQQVAPADLVYPKNPPLSPHICWINILLVGLAQILFGQGAKGLTILGIAFLGGMITGGLSFFIMAPIAIWDAYKVGKALKMGKTLTKWQWFPS